MSISDIPGDRLFVPFSRNMMHSTLTSELSKEMAFIISMFYCFLQMQILTAKKYSNSIIQ